MAYFLLQQSMDIERSTVGYIEFRGEVALTPLQQQMAKGRDERVILDWGDYKKHSWDKLASKITNISSKQLLVWNNRCPAILAELSHISFPNLTILIARNNHIVSAQNFIKMDCPQLKELDLCNNLLVSTRSFVKMDFPMLEKLKLEQNPIVNNEDLYKANLRRVAKIEMSSQEQLHQHYRISSDPILWKVKMQAALETNFHYNPYHQNIRGRRRVAVNDAPSLDYSKIKNMLQHKQPIQ